MNCYELTLHRHGLMNIQVCRWQRPILQVRVSSNQHRKLLIRRRRSSQPRQTFDTRNIQILANGKIRTTSKFDLWDWKHRERSIIARGADGRIKR